MFMNCYYNTNKIKLIKISFYCGFLIILLLLSLYQNGDVFLLDVLVREEVGQPTGHLNFVHVKIASAIFFLPFGL